MSRCVMLMRTSELGCRALIEIAFESISVRRQVGYLTVFQEITAEYVKFSGATRQNLTFFKQFQAQNA